MPVLDAIASELQYFDHLAPIWKALPEPVRGTFYASHWLATYATNRGITVHQGQVPRKGPPALVASIADYRRATFRPVVFVEHGAGQTYPDIPHSPAYSGGKDRDRTVLFICPNPTVAARNRQTYPHIPAAVVGSPRLDEFHPPTPKPITTPPTVAVTFHADIRVAPESASAFKWFQHTIPELTNHYRVLGHGHPRIYRRLAPFYNRWGIEPVESSRRILNEADVLVVDNSSIGFEFASLNRPVVWLSSPIYRRHITAWPRFWEALILGEHCETAQELSSAVGRALKQPDEAMRQARDSFIGSVYAYRDGRAADRAVEEIMEVVGG